MKLNISGSIVLNCSLIENNTTGCGLLNIKYVAVVVVVEAVVYMQICIRE